MQDGWIRRRFGVLVVLSAIGVSCRSTSQDAAEIEAILFRVSEDLQIRQHEAARIKLLDLLDRYPHVKNDRQVQLFLAGCEDELGDHAEAVRIYHELLAKPMPADDQLKILGYLGVAQIKLDQFELAAGTFLRAEELAKAADKGGYGYRRGIALQRAGKFPLARKVFEDVLGAQASADLIRKTRRRLALPDYFTVQVGAYGQEANARRVHRTLQRAGFSAELDYDPGNRTVPHYVYVGKFDSLDAARRMLERLQRSGALPPDVQPVTRP